MFVSIIILSSQCNIPVILTSFETFRNETNVNCNKYCSTARVCSDLGVSEHLFIESHIYSDQIIIMSFCINFNYFFFLQITIISRKRTKPNGSVRITVWGNYSLRQWVFPNAEDGSIMAKRKNVRNLTSLIAPPLICHLLVQWNKMLLNVLVIGIDVQI